MKIFTFLLLFLVSSYPTGAQSHTGYLTHDGAWCWFSDPRAIIVDDMIITGWVTSQGNIEAARLNLETDSIQTSELYFRLEQDDHDNPAFVHAANNEILAMYTRHSRKDLFINRLNDYTSDFEFSGAQLIHPFSDAELKKFPWETMSYANPYRLADEGNRIYCFGRWTGFKPNMMWSDDNGTTWSKSRVFITNYPFESNNRPYVKYASDGESKIHFVFTDGHPRDEPTNSVYYACYEKDAFYKASGELICTMGDIPFEPKDASVVYTSNPVDGRAWIADIGQNETGNPVILYTRSPEETNHEYWYARYTDKWWVNRKICNSGTWFPQTPGGKEEREKHYFGGLTIHPGNPGVIYLSRQINDVFEIERWETIDMGKTWKSEPITENSRYDNVRPYIPRGLEAVADEVVFWMENQKYLHYTNYESSIKYYIRQ